MGAELLSELVSRYSPSGQEAEAVSYLVDWMTAQGFAAHVDAAGNAVGVRGAADALQTLLLLGHIDTVPGEIPVRIEDGCLYGRGSVDAKGSLCAFAEATARAAIPSGWQVMVVGAVNEEADSRGAYYVRQQAQPTWCIIGEPSGANRITLGYKGHMRVNYRLTHPLAHSARPGPGVGELGVRLWQGLQAWAEGHNAGKERVFDQISLHLAAINTHDDGLHETVEMEINLRLPLGVSPEDARGALAALAEPDAAWQTSSAEAAYLAPKGTPLVRALLAAIRAQGEQPGFVLKSGTSDMNVMGEVWTCPIVAYGPGDSGLDHTPHEHLPLAEYQQAVRTLQYLIEHLP